MYIVQLDDNNILAVHQRGLFMYKADKLAGCPYLHVAIVLVAKYIGGFVNSLFQIDLNISF